MTNTLDAPHLRLTAPALLAAIWVGLAASAQNIDDDVDDDDAPPPQQIQFLVAAGQFDQYVFGVSRNADGARSRLAALQLVRIDEVERTCKITDAQKKKLELAARGDTKRFFDQVELKRKEFEIARTDQFKFQRFYQELQPLQAALQQGPFGEASLFYKTLKTILDESQTSQYEKTLRDRLYFRYRAKIDLAVAMTDNVIGLNAEQRKKLSTLLYEKTRVPKKFGPYDYQVVMLQLAKLPEETIKSIVNDQQWRQLSQQFDNARRMEPLLLKNGYLPDEPARPASK